MPGVGKRCIAESSVDAGAAVAHLQREQCCIGTRCGAPVPGVTGVHEAPETLSSRSFALRHHEQMLANAVSQRAVWVLVLRSLNYRLSNAVPMGGWRKNGGASVSGADRVHESSETLSSSFTLRHHAWM